MQSMHRQPQEPSREGKLWAACDRCHDLKNRCIRIGGPDSRCGRCERLDIDCVYQKSSRMGRPKRKASVVLSRQLESDEPSHRRLSSATSDMMPDMTLSAITVAGQGSAVVDGSEMGVDNISSGSATTLIESPFDVMSFLTTPEGISSADLDWGVDINHSAGTALQQDRLFEETHPSAHTTLLGHGTRLGNGNLPSPDPTNNTESYHGTSVPTPIPTTTTTTPPTPSLTDRLVQLQGRLHRLLSTNDAHSGADHVQEGLEAAKSFLSILQAGLDCSSKHLQLHENLPPAQPHAPPQIDPTQFLDPDNPPIQTDSAPINFITMQQTLTCYSYILSLLDRVVCLLTTGGTVPVPHEILNMNPATLSLGNFSLSSQPALNAELVLYLVLRMVQYLRALILRLAGRCREVAEKTTCMTAEGSALGEEPPRGAKECGLGRGGPSASLAGMSYAVSDLLVERERALVERLEGLTSQRGL